MRVDGRLGLTKVGAGGAGAGVGGAIVGLGTGAGGGAVSVVSVEVGVSVGSGAVVFSCTLEPKSGVGEPNSTNTMALINPRAATTAATAAQGV